MVLVLGLLNNPLYCTDGVESTPNITTGTSSHNTSDVMERLTTSNSSQTEESNPQVGLTVSVDKALDSVSKHLPQIGIYAGLGTAGAGAAKALGPHGSVAVVAGTVGVFAGGYLSIKTIDALSASLSGASSNTPFFSGRYKLT